MSELSQELTTFLRHLKTATEGVVDRAAIDESWAALTGEGAKAVPFIGGFQASDSNSGNGESTFVVTEGSEFVQETSNSTTVGAPAAAAEGGDGDSRDDVPGE